MSQADRDEWATLRSRQEADCAGPGGHKGPRLGLPRMGGLVGGSVGPSRDPGLLSAPDICPNLWSWIPGSPADQRGSPLKACFYLPFCSATLPLHATEASGAGGTGQTLPKIFHAHYTACCHQHSPRGPQMSKGHQVSTSHWTALPHGPVGRRQVQRRSPSQEPTCRPTDYR